MITTFNLFESLDDVEKLFSTVYDNHYEKLEKLIDDGVDINIRYNNRNILYVAINVFFTTHLADTKYIKLLIKNNIDLNTADDDGYTPLLYLSLFNINIDLFPDDYDFNQIVEIYKLMLKFGADPTVKSKSLTCIDFIENIIIDENNDKINKIVFNKVLLLPELKKMRKIKKFNL